ncbi:hypothetical protein ElyMa_005153300 [Elysia marginata]|uniref:Uncharacterized protein n=1 Tax=Elysia marginata TaxID=1093978 RepID=A0AAV4JTJ7_9GAST|nr:hypothetical protein ElyMa_005153300 [Elysia marginata]
MALLQHFLDDAIHGVKDSMSGWWVAVKCWQEEARLIQDKPPPPQAFSDLAKKRAEQRGGQVDDDEGMDICRAANQYRFQNFSTRMTTNILEYSCHT